MHQADKLLLGEEVNFQRSLQYAKNVPWMRGMDQAIPKPISLSLNALIKREKPAKPNCMPFKYQKKAQRIDGINRTFDKVKLFYIFFKVFYRFWCFQVQFKGSRHPKKLNVRSVQEIPFFPAEEEQMEKFFKTIINS